MSVTYTCLGIDPATRTGWALKHADGRCDHYGVFNMTSQVDRLSRFRVFLAGMLCHYRPDVVAAEGASFGAINQATKQFHAELLGVIKQTAQEHRAEVVVYHPSRIKAYATDCGHASKEQMIAAARTLLGIDVDDDNIADALWIADMGWRNYPARPEKNKAKRR